MAEAEPEPAERIAAALERIAQLLEAVTAHDMAGGARLRTIALTRELRPLLMDDAAAALLAVSGGDRVSSRTCDLNVVARGQEESP